MHAGGRRFDPVWLHHFLKNLSVDIFKFLKKGIVLNVEFTVALKVTAKQFCY